MADRTHADYSLGLHNVRPGARNKRTMCGQMAPLSQVDNARFTCLECRARVLEHHTTLSQALDNASGAYDD